MPGPSRGYIILRATKTKACMVVIRDGSPPWEWPDLSADDFGDKLDAAQTLIDAEGTEAADTSGERGTRDVKLALLHTKMQQFVRLGKQKFRNNPAKLRLLKPLRTTSTTVKGTLEQALLADAAWTEVDPTYVPESGNTCAAFHSLRLECVDEQALVAKESAEESDAGGKVAVALGELYRLSVDWYQEAIRRFADTTAHGMMIREEIPTQSIGVPGAPTLTVSGGAGAMDGNATSARATTIHWYYRLVGAGSFTEASTAPGEDVTFDSLAPGSYEVKVRGENAEDHGPESPLVTVTVT